MASKTGPRPLGTDGTDFMHRQRVASHYKVSSTFKWRLKFLSFMHIAVMTLMLLRLSVSLCVMFSVRPPSFLQRLRLPKAEMWEYWWIASLLPTLFGLIALRKNRIFLMKQYMLGTLTFGLAPVVYAIYDNMDDLLGYWETREAKLKLLGYPMVILWNMFFTIALQIHVFGLYFGWQLVKAWRPKAADKKKVT